MQTSGNPTEKLPSASNIYKWHIFPRIGIAYSGKLISNKLFYFIQRFFIFFIFLLTLYLQVYIPFDPDQKINVIQKMFVISLMNVDPDIIKDYGKAVNSTPTDKDEDFNCIFLALCKYFGRKLAKDPLELLKSNKKRHDKKNSRVAKSQKKKFGVSNYFANI